MMTCPVASGIFEEYWSTDVEYSEGWLTLTTTCPTLEVQPVAAPVPPDIVRDGVLPEIVGIPFDAVLIFTPSLANGGSNDEEGTAVVAVAAVVVTAAPVACRLWRILTGSCRSLSGSALRCAAVAKDERAAQ